MRFAFFLVLLVLVTLRLAGQEAVEERVLAMPYYSYGKGLGMTSPDSIYQLNIRFRMQNRATYSDGSDQKTTVDGQIRRLRLRFDGYVGSPKFTYLFQLSFAPGDVGEIEEGRNLNIIRDAVVFYQPNYNWTIGFGQTKLPGNRQRFNSSGALQLTDRTINNARFNVDRDFGLQVHYLKQFVDHFSYNLKTAVSTGEGRNYTDNQDAHLAYTGMVELYPFGAFTKSGEYFEGDVMRERTPKLMTSLAYQYNVKAKQTQGQTGEALGMGADIRSLFWDMIFKYQGLALMSSFMKRGSEAPSLFTPGVPQEPRFVYAGHGMDYQGSYLFRSDFELIGRYSWQKPAIARFAPDHKQFSLGLTKYIWEHAFKIQAEASYDTRRYFDGSAKDSWYFRLQTEIGI